MNAIKHLVLSVSLFCAGFITHANLSLLMEMNPNYEGSWLKVVAAVGFSMLFSWLMWAKAS